ncbi:MAG: MgtC/SapB family protein [Tissierellia bacterium]|nr:MgtC/SapB family protein [Tissierellia bacterium]
MVCGGLIGVERSRKSRPAGFRTYMLVCLSSSLIMMTSQYIYITFDASDPARLGAQVISGIGFLGAGTIIVTSRSQVKGLTSAAGLWAAACLGLAIGIGFYYGAIVVSIAVFLIITFFKKLDVIIASSNKIINIYVSFTNIECFDKFILHCHQLNFRINDMEISRDSSMKELTVIAFLSLESKNRFSHVDFIKGLSDFEGLIHIEEI